MYQITVEQHFDAAHFLRDYQGKCESMHGHRYRVLAKIKASELNEIGIAYDFTVLKKHLADIIARFDHTCINEVKPFDTINPSAENIAVTIYNELKPRLVEAPVSISYIEVWETPQNGACYSPD